jgi:hypothetical protein
MPPLRCRKRKRPQPHPRLILPLRKSNRSEEKSSYVVQPFRASWCVNKRPSRAGLPTKKDHPSSSILFPSTINNHHSSLINPPIFTCGLKFFSLQHPPPKPPLSHRTSRKLISRLIMPCRKSREPISSLIMLCRISRKLILSLIMLCQISQKSISQTIIQFQICQIIISNLIMRFRISRKPISNLQMPCGISGGPLSLLKQVSRYQFGRTSSSTPCSHTSDH